MIISMSVTGYRGLKICRKISWKLPNPLTSYVESTSFTDIIKSMPLLTVKFLKQIDRLRIRSQSAFRGKFKGERRSLNRGTGVEFADYRRYEIGDDLRYVDWNVYARLDRLFIKLFRADEDLPISLLVDNSRSMEFGDPTKLTCAKQIAAALGYIGLANLDRVSVHTLSDRATPIGASMYGKAQFAKLSQSIENIRAAGNTNLTDSLKRFAASTRAAGVAVIISDFLALNGYASGIKQLLARGFDLTLIHLLSHEELHPTLSGEWRLEDSETGQAKELTLNEQTIAHYRKRLERFCHDLERFCANRGVNYVRISNRVSIERLVLQDLRGIGLIQ
jgi:uncharacterized protein (DUF58 family)